MMKRYMDLGLLASSRYWLFDEGRRPYIINTTPRRTISQVVLMTTHWKEMVQLWSWCHTWIGGPRDHGPEWAPLKLTDVVFVFLFLYI